MDNIKSKQAENGNINAEIAENLQNRPTDGDLISRQAAIDALSTYIFNVYKSMTGKEMPKDKCRQAAESVLGELPTVQPTQKIIHCKDCKHWNLQVGNVKGDGLGSCDFHNVNFVTGEGFCYWADRRGDSDDID